MYFLNSQRTLCHVIEDMMTGKTPCGAKDGKAAVINYRYGHPHGLLEKKPTNIPLCKECENGMAVKRSIYAARL
jgi:hypothetical protein